MRSLYRKCYHLLNILIFTGLMTICYFYVDRELCLLSEAIRENHYISLRILSIITSPATQLTFWTGLFIWLLTVKKHERYVLEIYPIVASLIATNTVIRFVKIFFGRSRPDMFLEEGLYFLKFMSFERIYSSLPSGHASTVASILGLLAAKYPRQALFWISLTLMLSLCRVFIEAHYLSDVLIGNYLGFIFTWIFYFQQDDKSPAYLNYTQKEYIWNKIIPSKV